jgi:hypothetical protein
VAQWLRYCATNRKVTGSIPDGVTGIYHWHNPSDRTIALGSTQPLTETSTRSISWGWRRPAVRLTTLPPSCAVVMYSGNLNFLEPSGPFQDCNGTVLPLPFTQIFRWGANYSAVFIIPSWSLVFGSALCFTVHVYRSEKGVKKERHLTKF